MIETAEVARNVERLRSRIADAGGDPERTTIVAVTKGQPVEAPLAALAAGLVDLGENYGQELVAKAEALLAADARAGGRPPRWHFIGRLQRNKVRQVAPFVASWDSVDRLSLATEIARRDPAATVLVQVNLTDEPQKGGCRPEFLPAVVDGCRDLGLDVRGLMTVGVDGDPERTRAAFEGLRRLADDLHLDVRSMGMSADLEAAVSAGTTMVRVGTALFGARPRAVRVRD